jgi:hypothetical protein
MPSHDRVRLNEHQRRAPVPPHAGQGDPKQPVARPERRAFGRPFQRPQLLPQRDVLQDQFVVSAARQREPTGNHDEQLQHGWIVASVSAKINVDRGGPIFGERQDRDGLKATITTVEADGHSTFIQYTADYNRLEYRITGSNDFDTIALQRINANTSEATLMHASKEVGMARRVISTDGKTLTITLHMTDTKGQTVVNNVEVLEKQSR